MNSQQIKYAVNRLTEEYNELIRLSKPVMKNADNCTAIFEMAERGEIPIKSKEEILKTLIVKGKYNIYYTDLFDEKALKECSQSLAKENKTKEANFNKNKMALDKIFKQAKDELMLGSAGLEDLAKYINELKKVIA